jgi:excinuclease ABC subunit C
MVSLNLASLKEILNQNSTAVLNLNRIECYDISNTSGINATGSMVVFTKGEKDSASYRRFKIKKDYKNKPNDFAMMQEMLERRLKHNDWPKPSLIVVDGGKGQVSSVKQIINNLSLQIPLIGLAKREETIITSDLKEIKLAKDSKALQLIMRLRDEAHRFAITYHKKLRAKATFV